MEIGTAPAAVRPPPLDEALRASLSLLPVALLTLDTEGKLLVAEGGALAHAGMHASELIGHSLLGLSAPLDWLSDVAADAIAGKEASARGTGINGSLFEATFRPVSSPERKIAWVVGLVREVTESPAALLHTTLKATQEEKQARAAAEEAARRAAFLAEASRKLNESLDYETTIRTISRVAIPEFTDGCVVFLLEGDHFTQLAVAHREPQIESRLLAMFSKYPPDPNAPVGMGRVVRSGEAYLYPEVRDTLLQQLARSPEHLQMLRGLQMKSYLIAPMTAHGHALGVLGFGTVERHFTPADLKLAEELARRCAAAVENAKLFQQAEKAIKLRDDFLAVASHELRTPLTPLRIVLDSLAARLRKGEGDPLTLLSRAQRSVERLGELVNDLLDVSQLEAGRLKLQSKPFSMSALVLEVVHELEGASPRHRIVIDRLAEDVVVVGDHDRIVQVLTNLLDNAIKYSPQGGDVRLSLTTTPRDTVLSVTDQGVGIPAEQQGLIFGRFSRATTAPISRFGGLGLGLYICRTVVDRHGGRIWVESEVGKGSTFFVSLPRAIS